MLKFHNAIWNLLKLKFPNAMLTLLLSKPFPPLTARSYRVFTRSASVPTCWHFNLICPHRSGRLLKAEGLCTKSSQWQRTIRWGRLSCNLAAFQYVKAATGRATHSHTHTLTCQVQTCNANSYPLRLFHTHAKNQRNKIQFSFLIC